MFNKRLNHGFNLKKIEIVYIEDTKLSNKYIKIPFGTKIRIISKKYELEESMFIYVYN